MSKHYKKLILLLIPACAGFCLALALGSAEEPSELCHLCQNKALVREAILAADGFLYSWPPSEQFDPNFVLWEPWGWGGADPNPPYPANTVIVEFGYHASKLVHIIAEGNMVSVLVRINARKDATYSFDKFQMVMYRIANGKIVEGWIAPFWSKSGSW